VVSSDKDASESHVQHSGSIVCWLSHRRIEYNTKNKSHFKFQCNIGVAGTDVANKANGTENSQEMWKKNHWEIIGGLLPLGPPLGSKTQNRVYHVRSDRNSQQSKHNCNTVLYCKLWTQAVASKSTSKFSRKKCQRRSVQCRVLPSGAANRH